MHYVDEGKGDPIVLLHGNPTWGFLYRDMIAPLIGSGRRVIVSDLDEDNERKYWPSADRGVFPGSSSNHHLHTLPALLVAIREMRQHATAYAAQLACLCDWADLDGHLWLDAGPAPATLRLDSSRPGIPRLASAS